MDSGCGTGSEGGECLDAWIRIVLMTRSVGSTGLGWWVMVMMVMIKKGGGGGEKRYVGQFEHWLHHFWVLI